MEDRRDYHFDGGHEDEVDWAYETDADDVERGTGSLLGTTCLEGYPTVSSPLRGNPFARKRTRTEISEGSTDEVGILAFFFLFGIQTQAFCLVKLLVVTFVVFVFVR